MKHFLIILFIFIGSLTFSQDNKPINPVKLNPEKSTLQMEFTDSTRLKAYENYFSQAEATIQQTQSQISQLQELLQQLVGAREAFKLIIADEKKRLGETIKK